MGEQEVGAKFPEKSIFTRATLRNIPVDTILHLVVWCIVSTVSKKNATSIFRVLVLINLVKRGLDPGSAVTNCSAC
jgi:hypothetical protein